MSDPTVPRAPVPGTKPVPPPPVRLAFGLWIAQCLVRIVADGIMLAVTRNFFEPPSLADDYFAVSVLLLVVGTVALAVPMRAGRNGARITLAVLGLLSILPAVQPGPGTGQTEPLLLLASGLVGAGITCVVVAVVLMFWRVSNEYFRGRAAWRSMR